MIKERGCSVLLRQGRNGPNIVGLGDIGEADAKSVS